MNIIFAGTPDFAVVTLDALLRSTYSVRAVYTQPDRPAGRGLKINPSPVKAIANLHDLPLFQPVSLRDEYEEQTLKKMNPDLLVVVAYGLLLPKRILAIPKLGCINIHASLLPRWRGAAPIQRALLAGDKKTGISIMHMEETLDTGPILYQIETPITPEDTTQTLHDRLAILGGDALLYTLEHFHKLKAHPQNRQDVTYAHKILKEEAKINWANSAIEIDRKIRAFNPWPVAFTHINGKMVRLWEGALVKSASSSAQTGEIIAATSTGLTVMTGEGAICISKMQLPGGRMLPVKEILNANRADFVVGNIFH